ncbi:MAG: amidohydrolase [Candidatus Hodarchaeales archaeon]|jgi:5-methylthioadenosine/S-adenosylhomocysteine deaminase
MEILLRDVILVSDTFHTSSKRTNIVIEDNQITEIGPNAKLASPEYIIQGKNLVVLPPALNAHTHLPMTLLRGYSDNKILYDWLADIWAIEGKFDPGWIELGTRLACLEAIKAGTGGFLDFYFHSSVIGQVIKQAGLRGWLGSGLLPSAFVDQGGLEFQLKEFKRTIDIANSSSLLTAAIAPHSPTTVEEEYLLQSRDLAAKHNIPITIHASETRKEVLDCEEKHGVPPVERLDQIGFFQEGTKEVVAHCAWITQREVEILGKHHAMVAWCPSSAQKLAYAGVTPIPELRKAGAVVALGTDGTASNNTLDLYREMREAVNMVSFARWDPAIYPAEEVLEDTHWSFRRYFHPKSLIKVGNKADLVVVDFQKPHLQPIHNVVSNLVYAANGSDVYSLVVDGNVLMHERIVSTLDEKKILEEIETKIPDLVNE